MSSYNRNDRYLETKALTAPPHRLHLMLIDGALRFARQAAAALDNGDEGAASAPLTRLVDIAGELLAGVRQNQSELNSRLSKLYFYLFHTVSVAKINFNREKLSDALSLLEFERETWQMLCDRLGTETRYDGDANGTAGTVGSTGGGFALELPIDSAPTGLSLQA